MIGNSTANLQARKTTMPRISTVTLAATLAFSISCSRQGEMARLPPTTAAPAPASPAASPTPKPVAAAPAPATAGKAPAGEPAADTIPPPPPGSSFLSGQTEAHRKSTLTPKVSSTVTRVLVRDGDIVKNGQALVVLDTRDFQLRLQQADAAAQAAKVQLDSARLDWNRTRALLGDKAVPQSQFDMVDARYKGAQAGVLQAETAVAMGKKALQDATVHAPFNGIVVKRMVNEGEYASVMPATSLVILEEIDPLDLRVQIPSTDVDRVKAGDTIHVRFPATGQALDVRLTRVVAALDPRTRTFSAIAELPNKDHGLHSGLYAEITLTGKSASVADAAAKHAAAKPGVLTARPAATTSKD